MPWKNHPQPHRRKLISLTRVNENDLSIQTWLMPTWPHLPRLIHSRNMRTYRFILRNFFCKRKSPKTIDFLAFQNGNKLQFLISPCFERPWKLRLKNPSVNIINNSINQSSIMQTSIKSDPGIPKKIQVVWKGLWLYHDLSSQSFEVKLKLLNLTETIKQAPKIAFTIPSNRIRKVQIRF